MSGVLGGLKVADFSWVATGPSCTRYLADHGATVVRVESRTNPDMLRTSPPFRGGTPRPDAAGYFANYNAGKYGMTLAMDKPQGREIARRLARWCDVLVESFSPGVMKRWGLDYEALRQLNPQIIMASTTQLGQTGPYAAYRGFGQQGAALAGFYHVTGWPDGEPVGPYAAYTDFVAHRYLMVAILGALFARRRTGRGEYIDHSQVESSIHFLAPAVLDYVTNGRVQGCSGNSDPHAAPHGAYRCQGEDRWCVIAVNSDDDWARFREAIGDPGWAREDRFATKPGRKRNEAELDRLVEEWTGSHASEEVMTALQAHGVAAGIVETAEDLHKDPQLKYRGHFWVLEHAEIGKHTYDGPGFRLSKTPAELKMAAPCLGAHNYYVCTGILGMSDDEFLEFDRAGALG